MSILVQTSSRAPYSPSFNKSDRMMHSSSKVWVNPRIRENHRSNGSNGSNGSNIGSGNRHALNHARSQVCRKSAFWTEDFDLKKHREAWQEGKLRHQQEKLQVALKEEKQLQRSQSCRDPIVATVRPPFNAQDFADNRGYVLAYETVFCPTFDRGSKKDNIAPWPSKAEAKYEGEDRISTDRLHRRFPGAPRVESGGDGVAWNCLKIIDQFPFDDFYFPIPQAMEVFLRTHYIDDLEFDDEEGEKILGQGLFDVLDPDDQW